MALRRDGPLAISTAFRPRQEPRCLGCRKIPYGVIGGQEGRQTREMATEALLPGRD